MVTRTVAAALLVAVPAVAQVQPVLPFERQLDLLVVDTAYDGVWRLSDQNQDGDYLDPGEIVSFYSDAVGAFAWSTPQAIVAAADGTVYVGEVTSDAIYALRDGNSDSDANDPGEARVFYDSTNVSGLPIPQIQGLTVDALGRVFAAVNNASTPAGPDRILCLHDLNSDGDANDANEALDYYTMPGTTGVLGASIPTKVLVGPDGNVYYTEVSSTGAFTKGVWRLVDSNLNGHCNDPGEASLFWDPPFTASPFYWSLAVDWAGNFYVSDHSANEQIWRGRDNNNDGTIDPTEEQLYFQSPGSSWWDLMVRDDGTILVCDTDGDDRITALRDNNNDGDAVDPGEAWDAYNQTLTTPTVAPRGAAFLRAPKLTLQPASVQVGNSTNLATEATQPGNLVLTVISIGLGPNFPLAPWGMVEVDVTSFASVALGFADPNGLFTAPFTIPNNPALVGSFAFQSLAGDAFRLFLSNASVLTVTP